MSNGRTTRMKALTVGLGAAALLAVAAMPAIAQTEITKIAYISPEAATDYGWNQQGLAGAEAAAAAIGAELIPADGSAMTTRRPSWRSSRRTARSSSSRRRPATPRPRRSSHATTPSPRSCGTSPIRPRPA